jgi:Smr domain-containing protein
MAPTPPVPFRHVDQRSHGRRADDQLTPVWRRVWAGFLAPTARCRPCVLKLKLDLHEIYSRGDDIDRALRAVIDEAIEKRVRLVEIIPGKGSGQLKKHVLRFLDRKDIKPLYDRVEKDPHNFGRVFVHFRPK